MSAPEPKRSRLEEVSVESIIERTWTHYRSFLDSLERDGDGVGDIDELVELLEILEPYLKETKAENNALNGSPGRTIESLLPVLASVSHYHLASVAIDEAIERNQLNKCDAKHESVQQHLHKASGYYRMNAAAQSIAANYARMRADPQNEISLLYEMAARSASDVRDRAVQLMRDDGIQDEVKEWIELLLLDAVAGVEFVGEDDQIEDHEDDDEPNNHDLSFSCSAVESTARFMLAMLYSNLNQHEDALRHLRKFDLTHRLHPKVWQSGAKSRLDDGTIPARNEPVCFGSPVLPPSIHQQLCQLLVSDAPYWKESDYAHRGYYSYYFDIATTKERPSNLIEDVIVTHLLPLAQNVLDTNMDVAPDTKIVGAEWWPHSRPTQANLGHQLHFDTDEALLSKEGRITHPILSSVLYLAGSPGDGMGATIVLDQTPNCTARNAKRVWRSVPRENSYMLFPGNFLHGVLPCSRKMYPEDDEKIDRLTFMVGFWTRSVPDGMTTRKLYGPCGPLPPATDEHTWVRSIQEGYGKATTRDDTPKSSNKKLPNPEAVPQVSPAWEEISCCKCGMEATALHDSPPLQIPKALDHRFFVHGAPQCFRESLFQKDEYDEDADEST